MSLNDQISTAMKEAMKAKDSLTLDTVRMAKSALKNKEIDKMSPLTEAEGFAVIQTLIKQRQESTALYRSGGREELAKKEEDEIEILRRFMPAQLSDAELDQLVRDTVQDVGASDIKQMGAVIKAVMPKVAGRADGGRVSAAVKKALGA